MDVGGENALDRLRKKAFDGAKAGPKAIRTALNELGADPKGGHRLSNEGGVR